MYASGASALVHDLLGDDELELGRMVCARSRSSMSGGDTRRESRRLELHARCTAERQHCLSNFDLTRMTRAARKITMSQRALNEYHTPNNTARLRCGEERFIA